MSTPFVTHFDHDDVFYRVSGVYDAPLAATDGAPPEPREVSVHDIRVRPYGYSDWIWTDATKWDVLSFRWIQDEVNNALRNAS